MARPSSHPGRLSPQALVHLDRASGGRERLEQGRRVGPLVVSDDLVVGVESEDVHVLEVERRARLELAVRVELSEKMYEIERGSVTG